MAIKTLVFEQGKLSLTELKAALDSNFGAATSTAIPASTAPATDQLEALIAAVVRQMMGDQHHDNQPAPSANRPAAAGNGEYIRQLLLNGAPKYGNDIDEVDNLARETALIYCREVQKYKNPRNGQFQPGLYPVSANVPMGQITGATADGRKAGEPLADGVSPASGRDQAGPTAALNSVAKLDHSIASNGTLLNQKFHPSALSGQEGLSNLSALVRGFFDQKGMHVQFNVVSKEMLQDAQQHPDKYKNLVVRVAGYSAHFVSLDRSIQEDIISRTEQSFQ